MRDWVSSFGLDPTSYGTHSMRRTKVAHIYTKTGNLRAVQLLLGHTKMDSTVRYLDEVFVKINGETHYHWRAVDLEGEVLESYATKRRDRKAALKFLRKLMKRYGGPKAIVTDKLRSYGTAMKVIGNAPRQETGRWLNNRAENAHLPFRRRERAMLRFRQMRSLQKFSAVHSSVHNHFNQERHLYSRLNFIANRTAALSEWRALFAA